MKKKPGLLSISLLFAMACSGGGSTATEDLGTPEDQGSSDGGSGDLAGSTDMAIGTQAPGLQLLSGYPGGLGSADGVGTLARFNYAQAIAADGLGNAYVADSNNKLIRKLDLATGKVTTLAQTQGYTYGVAADGAGNVYFSDQGDFSVRKVVVSTGQVSLVAGGSYGYTDATGGAAQFSGFSGMALDGTNLYVSDSNMVRKIDLTNAKVTTVAGTRNSTGGADGTGIAAQLGNPLSLTADGKGSLFAADWSNHTVRQITASTGVVLTLAGMAGSSGAVDGLGGVARFNQPSGITTDGNGNLYVSDQLNYTIRKVVVPGGQTTTLAGKLGSSGAVDATGGAARLWGTYGIVLPKAGAGLGSLYVTELNNQDIRKIDLATVAVTTFAGKPSNAQSPGPMSSFCAPADVVSDGAGKLYVADSCNHAIRQVDTKSGTMTTLAGTVMTSGSTDAIGTAASFKTPQGLALDGQGNLYVADTLNQIIRKISLSDAKVTTLAGTLGVQGGTNATGTSASFNFPVGLTFDESGALYVSDNIGCTIRKIDMVSIMVTTVAGTNSSCGSVDAAGSAARFYANAGIVSDRAGTLYVADSRNQTIRKLDLATKMVTTIAGTAGSGGSGDGTGPAAQFGQPRGVRLDGKGNLYITDFTNHTVRKLELATQMVTTVVGVPGQAGFIPGPLPGVLSSPWGLDFLPNHGLAISASGENTIAVAGGL